MKKSINRFLSITIIVFIGFYCFFLSFLYFSQKSLLYFPDTTDFYDCSYFSEGEQREYKSTRFYERKGKKDGVIVFFHGNAGRACDRMKIAGIFEKSGYGYILVEYSGYAGNAKEANIENILEDTRNIVSYLQSAGHKNIISVGRSIGTGPASYLAGLLNVDKLLLVSPYPELYKIAADKYPFFPVKYLFTQNYNLIEYLQNYTGELLIFHGNKDKIIPQKFGKELYQNLNSLKKEFYNVDKGSHNNELYRKGVKEKILEFLRK